MFITIYKLCLSTILIQILCLKLTASSNDTVCTALKSVFAERASKFTTCVVDNARPVNVCENCVNLYIKLQKSYINMTQLEIDNETRCIDNYINLDRLQIIKTTYGNSVDLWNRAKCNDCFEFANGALTPNKSTNTLTFEERYSNFSNCMNKTYENATEMCSACFQAYVNLDQYYSSITNVNEDIGGCMDVVDLMNTTRTYFSEKCCKFRKHNEYLYIVSSSIVLALTLFFYLLTQKWSEIKIPTILQQTRFAASLNQLD